MSATGKIPRNRHLSTLWGALCSQPLCPFEQDLMSKTGGSECLTEKGCDILMKILQYCVPTLLLTYDMSILVLQVLQEGPFKHQPVLVGE